MHIKFSDKNINIDIQGYTKNESIDIIAFLKGCKAFEASSNTHTVPVPHKKEEIQSIIDDKLCSSDERERLPNNFTELYNHFACPHCNQGIFIHRDDTVIAKSIVTGKLYELDGTMLNRYELEEEITDDSLLIEIATDLSKAISNVNANLVNISYDDDTIYGCPICDHKYTLTDYIIAHRKLELEKVCMICGGEVEYLLDDNYVDNDKNSSSSGMKSDEICTGCNLLMEGIGL